MLLEKFSNELSEKPENQDFQEINGAISCVSHKDLTRTSTLKDEQPVSVIIADKD